MRNCLVATLFFVIPLWAGAADSSDSATFVRWDYGQTAQDTVTATLVDRTLTFTGNGAMDNCWGGNDEPPWLEYNSKSSITNVVIGAGITSIGARAFYYCTDLQSIRCEGALLTYHPPWDQLPPEKDGRVIYVPGAYAVEWQSAADKYGMWHGFRLMPEYWCLGLGPNSTVTNTVTARLTDGHLVISGKGNTKYSYLASPFTGLDIRTAVIEEGVSNVLYDCFNNQTNLCDVTIGPDVSEFSQYAFYGCTGLTNMTFIGGCPSVKSSALKDVPSNTVVRVPSYEPSWVDVSTWQGMTVATYSVTCAIGTPTASDVIATMSTNGTLSIDGVGAIADPTDIENAVLFRHFCKLARRIVISNGITSLSHGLFAGASNCTDIRILGPRPVAYDDTFADAVNATIYYLDTEQESWSEAIATGTWCGHPLSKLLGLPYLSFESAKPFSLGFVQRLWEGTLECSTNGTDWFVFPKDVDMSPIQAGIGNSIYAIHLRGTGNTCFSYNGKYYTYKGNICLNGEPGTIDCRGTIETLLDYATVEVGGHPTLGDYAFCYFFYTNTALRTPPSLTSTNLTIYCYKNMFNGCNGLETAPALPVMTLAEGCYNAMFDSCTNLALPPALPAMTLTNSCYAYMFNDCTSLLECPILPATTLAESCYTGMFDGCTKLKVPATLPALVLAYKCYDYMFYDTEISITRDRGYFAGRCRPWHLPLNFKFNGYKIKYMFGKKSYVDSPECGVLYFLNYVPCPSAEDVLGNVRARTNETTFTSAQADKIAAVLQSRIGTLLNMDDLDRFTLVNEYVDAYLGADVPLARLASIADSGTLAMAMKFGLAPFNATPDVKLDAYALDGTSGNNVLSVDFRLLDGDTTVVPTTVSDEVIEELKGLVECSSALPFGSSTAVTPTVTTSVDTKTGSVHADVTPPSGLSSCFLRLRLTSE